MTLSVHPLKQCPIYHIVFILANTFVLLIALFKLSNFDSIANKVWHVGLLFEYLIENAVKLTLDVEKLLE